MTVFPARAASAASLPTALAPSSQRRLGSTRTTSAPSRISLLVEPSSLSCRILLPTEPGSLVSWTPACAGVTVEEAGGSWRSGRLRRSSKNERGLRLKGERRLRLTGLLARAASAASLPTALAPSSQRRLGSTRATSVPSRISWLTEPGSLSLWTPAFAGVTVKEAGDPWRSGRFPRLLTEGCHVESR